MFIKLSLVHLNDQAQYFEFIYLIKQINLINYLKSQSHKKNLINQFIYIHTSEGRKVCEVTFEI